MVPSPDDYAARASVFKALGHPARLLMVDALAKGELCVADLTALVGADVSTVSRHLLALREAGVVACRKAGTSVYYRLSMACAGNFLTCVDAHLRQEAMSRLAVLKPDGARPAQEEA